MHQGLTQQEIQQFLELKFKEKDFLDNLYLELSKIFADKSQIAELDSEQLTKIIIDKNLLDKILTGNSSAQRSTPQAQTYAHPFNKRSAKPNSDPFAPQFRTLNSAGFNASMRGTLTGQADTGDMNFNQQRSNSDPNSDYLGIRLGVNLMEMVKFPLKSDTKQLQICVSFLETRALSILLNYTSTLRILQKMTIPISSRLQSISSLLKLKTPLRFTLIELDTKSGEKNILSIKDIEWRYVLAHEKLKLNMAFQGVKQQAGGDLGVLKLEVFIDKTKLNQKLLEEGQSLPKTKLILVDEDVLQKQLDREKEDIAVKIKDFYEFSQDWWVEYKHLDPNFANRAVKIYAEDLFGTLKPVCHFVQKLQCRAVSSPLIAARYVSLIPFEQNDTGLTSTEVPWSDVGSFLNRKKGTAIEHALLLCSLLIGFKIDAYVCLGSSSDGTHAWVITRSTKKVKVGYQGNEKEVLQIKIWESLTGKILSMKDPRVGMLYKRVGCVFNNNRFYANMQRDDLVSQTNFLKCLQVVGCQNIIRT